MNLPPSTPLVNIPFSARAKRAIEQLSPPVFTVGELQNTPDCALFSFRGCGLTTIREIRSKTGNARLTDPPCYRAIDITVRDYFAAKAMQALIVLGAEPARFASAAYGIADAMLAKAREP